MTVGVVYCCNDGVDCFEYMGSGFGERTNNREVTRVFIDDDNLVGKPARRWLGKLLGIE